MPRMTQSTGSAAFDIPFRFWGVLVATVLLLGTAGLAYAQCGSLAGPSTSAVPAGGDFNTAGTWSAGSPNSATNACIINAGPTLVTLGPSAVGNVNSLQLGSNNTLNLLNNSQLNVFGTQIINNGAIGLNAGANNAVLLMETSTTLSGAGVLTLSQSGGGAAVIEQAVGGLALTNASTIQGAGTIGNNGLAVNNQATGIINANATGLTLVMNGGGAVTNAGLLEATNGGTLLISGNTVANAGGNISAIGSGSVVSLASATINGGTLNTSGGGVLGTAPGFTSTLNGVTISSGSTFTNGNNADLFVSGAITNNGTIQVNAGANNSILGLTAGTTLSGGGTVNLSQSGGGAAVIQQQVGGLTLNNTNNTIQGAGNIGNGGGLAIINGGTINANASTQTLFLDTSGGITNNNLLEATGGGTLNILATTVANTGANISAIGSAVLLTNATINGGTLNTSGGGVLGTASGFTSTLNGVTISSGSTFTNGNNADLFVSGAITNNGTIQVNAGANNSILLLVNNTTLNGGGTVNLSQSGGGAALIEQSVGGLTLNNVNNTIQGAGIIGNNGLVLVNDAAGTILANAPPGQTLLINGSGGLTNNGTVQVNTGSALEVTSAFSQTGGRTQADGTLIVGAGETVSGGTALGTGTIDGDVTLAGGVMQPGELNIPGMLTLNGNYDQTGGIFSELISNTGNGLLFINGVAFLGSGADLGIDLLGGFIPTPGEMFTIMDFTSGSGTFANAPTSGFMLDGFDWSIAYNANDIVLTFEPSTTPAPEPGSMLLLGIGLAGLALSLWRKRAVAKR